MISKVSNLPGWLDEGAQGNLGTLWQVVKSYQSNRRQGTVGVKTRSLVKATGKKPYKQKKTGNARTGSMVNNIHVGGGVSHGPQMRSYREAIPDGMARKALALALAKRVEAGKVYTGELGIATGKTRDAAKLVAACVEEFGKTLIVLDAPTPETIRAYRNLRGIVLVSPEQVTALDVMETRNLISSPGAWSRLEGRVSKKKAQGVARA
jgi:large subunit ribosomal protein L4